MQAASSEFVELLRPSDDRIGLVAFNDNATLLAGLSSNFAAVTAQINALTAEGGTDIASGLEVAYLALSNDSRAPDARPVIVLLTDGQNRADEERLLAIAKDARAQGVRIITVGLGTTINADLLARVAFAPADAYLAPTAAELQTIYRSIAQALICHAAAPTP